MVKNKINTEVDELKDSDLFMMRLILAHWFIATFITSNAFNTYIVGFVVGGLITLGTYLAYRFYPGTRYYRVVLAIAIMSFSALFIQQFYGRIEFHFHVFVGLAFLTIYRDRLPVAVGSIFIILHHLIFNYLQQYNISIFDHKVVVFNYGCGLDIVILHGIFVLAEWFVLDKHIKRKIKVYDLIIESKNVLRHMNHEIEKEKTKYQELMSLASDGVFIMNMEGKLLECSDMAAKMLGYTKKDMLNLYVYDWDVSHSKKEALDHVKNTPLKPLTFETRHKRKDGTIYDAEIKVVKININKEELVYASVRDITSRKHDEKIIKEQKEEFEAIFRNSKDGIAILDMDLNFIDFNDAYLEMTGFSRDELLTKSELELSSIEDKRRMEDLLPVILKEGYVENFEMTCVVKDEKRVQVNMTISILPDNERLLLVAKDVTSLKLLEQQSKLASMGEMIGNIAHQWRQPLSVITTSASAMDVKVDFKDLSDSEIKSFSNNIIKQADYLSKTIDDFRNFIKGDIKYSQISIKEVLENTIGLVDATLKNNYIRLIDDIDTDMDIYGNKNELSQALINIINNAKDSMKELNSSEKLLFIKTEKTDDDSIELKILDSGGGIASDVIDRVFEPYFTTKHKSLGTGIGLSMVAQIIKKRHKGDISVHNEEYEYEGKNYIGACFSIKFLKKEG